MTIWKRRPCLLRSLDIPSSMLTPWAWTWIRGALLFAILALALSAHAQNVSYRDVATIPDTPAYQRAQEVIELLNAPDSLRIAGYLAKNFTPEFLAIAPLEQHVRVHLNLARASGGFDIHSARIYEPATPENDAVLVVRNRLTDGWQAVVLSVEPSAPHRIASMRFAPARRPSDLPAGEALADDEIARRLEQYVKHLSEAGAFSGTVLLARNGQVLMQAAEGMANRDFAAPVNLDTKFNLGSMNKMFTAVAIAQLVEQGKVAFEQPIGRYLDSSWVSPQISGRVTVHHLLTHTSGLGSYFNPEFVRSSRLLFRDVDDFRALVHGDTLAFEPGTAWQYSNTGYLLLGVIIERASGESYFSYIRKHITGPAGMTSTDCYELDRVNPNLAVGYERYWEGDRLRYRNNIFDHVVRGGPAGGGYSTVGDLLRFDAALRASKLVSKTSLDRLWRAYPEMKSPDYGYGFMVLQTPAGRMVGHSGGFTGISAQLAMYLDSGYTLAVLSNDGEGAPPVVLKAREWIEQGR